MANHPDTSDDALSQASLDSLEELPTHRFNQSQGSAASDQDDHHQGLNKSFDSVEAKTVYANSNGHQQNGTGTKLTRSLSLTGSDIRGGRMRSGIPVRKASYHIARSSTVDHGILENGHDDNDDCDSLETFKDSLKQSCESLAKYSCIGSQNAPIETITSRRRREITHSSHGSGLNKLHLTDNNDYLTPFQRKERTIAQLKDEIKRLKSVIDERHDMIDAYEENKVKEIARITSEKDAIIASLRNDISELRKKYEDLTVSHQEAVQSNQALKATIANLKEEIEKKHKENQEYFLHMFEKGKQSASFERQSELERIAREHPESVSNTELIEKLTISESQLQKWQTYRRQESYEEAPRPQTEAEVMVNFLRDSLFHYLTDKQDKASHMRAMIGIIGFTNVQMKRIEKASMEKNAKKKNKTK